MKNRYQQCLSSNTRYRGSISAVFDLMLRKKIFLFVLISICCIYFLITAILINSTFRIVPQKESSTMLIMGGSLIRTSATTRYPSPWLQSRMQLAMNYLQNHPQINTVICTGKGFEADIICDYLKKQEYNHAIKWYKDRFSANSWENLLFAKKLVNFNDAIVVTSDYHMYRTLLLAKRLGIKVEGLAAEFKGSWWSRTYHYIRESLALGKSYLFDR